MPRSADRYGLLHKRLVLFTRVLPGVEESDVRAVHRMRVASRRLREVLPVLQLDAEVTQKLSRRLRKITERLGTVRELDVLPGLIDELGQTDRYRGPALARVAAAVTEQRNRARDRVLAKSHVRELRRVGAKLDKLARALQAQNAVPQRGTQRRSWIWAIDARVARRASTLAAAIADAGAIYLPERLHVVRIAVKTLRYALELSAEVAQLKTTPDLKQLRRAQDILGRLHDLQVLMERTREAQASLTPPDVTTWRQFDAVVAALEDDCRRLHGRFMNDRDALSALCTRLSGHTKEVKSQKAEVRRI